MFGGGVTGEFVSIHVLVGPIGEGWPGHPISSKIMTKPVLSLDKRSGHLICICFCSVFVFFSQSYLRFLGKALTLEEQE